MPNNLSFNPRSEAFRDDPIAVYNSLRTRGPVFRNEDGTCIVIGHQASMMVLRDAEHVSKATEWRLSRMVDGRFKHYCANTMAFMDGPDHMRNRRAVQPALSPMNIKKMTAQIEDLCDELLDPLVGKAEFDFIEDFAGPFPLYVICNMLGIGREHREIFRHGAGHVVAALEPFAPAEITERANRSCEKLGHILTEAAANHAADADGDLTSYLKSQQEAGVLTWDEYINEMMFILVAGHETTATLLSRGMKILIDRPDLVAALRADPALMPTAVAEMLRLHPPLQFVPRFADKPFELEGVAIQAGEPIFVLIGGANRDPLTFPDPDAFDLTRKNAAQNLAFAAGAHTCLGNNLSRLEAKIAFEKILDRLPNLTLARAPTPNANFMFQGFDAMPLKQ